MITVYQANGSTVTPLADARLYQLLSGSAVGVVLGCEITSLGANQLRVGAGWILILGRCIEIQEETILATTSTGGQVDGRLVLHLDVSNNETPGTWVTQAQTPLPDLIQEDINGSGTIYELPLATYQVDQLQITELQTVPAGILQPVVQMYTGTLLIDGWAATNGEDLTNGYNWKQTVTLVPDEANAPAVTEDSVFITGCTYTPTGVVETDEILDEALAIINAGKTTSGAGTVTTLVVDKPEADIPARWAIRPGGGY